jgi:cardiolipin synthase A/B
MAEVATTPGVWVVTVPTSRWLPSSRATTTATAPTSSATTAWRYAGPNAYFFPGYRLLRELRRAAQRGVQVDLVLSARPDVPWVQHASELLYVYLLRAGVCVHEYHERPLHAKVAVVDDHWATIGSSNLDPTSLGLNLEANVVMRDKAFAVALRERIERLMQQRCNRVQKQSMTPLRSAWVALRSFVLFHALRRFPVWIRMFPSSAPRVEPLRQDAT